MKAPQDLEFTPPDDAVWEIDSLHSPRPLTAMGASIFGEPQTEGWRSLGERYGMLVNGPERRTVHRFGYTTLRGAIGSGKPSGPPRRWQLWLALRLHPVLRARRAAANRAWKGQLWRDDLRLWDTEAKPGNVARHQQLLALELESLTDAELATHIEECHLQACDMARQHAYFKGVAFNPLGDFLAHVLDWTGLEGPEVITLFQGLSPLSSGWVPELDALVEALRDDSEAQGILGSERDAGETLDALVALPGAAGSATAAYRDVVGYRVVGGYDVAILARSNRRRCWWERSGKPWPVKRQCSPRTRSERRLNCGRGCRTSIAPSSMSFWTTPGKRSGCGTSERCTPMHGPSGFCGALCWRRGSV